MWKDKAPLLSSNPYQRALARFWVDYLDKKIYSSIRGTILNSKGEEQEKAKKELLEGLKVLEEELQAPLWSWFYAIETLVNISIEAACPKLIAWAKRCMQRESASKSLPDSLKIYDFVLQLRKKFGVVD
ncbi:probable glutathione S-transferase parA [Macadamia integrifolia]|uniref:probable glutathione S-transferase parA n=1 Tax=Macadamia integrifolia TaxID=60698 RepID=UPI001C4FA48D|nr:probable glutathione S-transferase parA [Macadamia integrifolia]